MSRLRHRKPRRRLLGPQRRRPLKTIALLPSLVTLINGIFGFTAIALASSPDKPDIGPFTRFSLAGYCVIFAMIADMLDGRLARMSQTTSSFGGQLDSLCDMISFGAAPAFLALQILQQELSLRDLSYGPLVLRFLWLTAIAYLSCAAIRLARFNVENEEQESAHMAFTGLPSPAAAGVVVSYVIFHQEVMPSWTLPLWILPALSWAVALLMVGRVPYPHVLNQYLRGRKPFDYLLKTLLFLGLVVWSRQAALLLIFGSFAGSGVIRAVVRRLHRHRVTASAPASEGPPTASSS